MAKSTSDLPHNLVAFVNDPVSEQIIWNVIREMNMAYAEAKMGSISDVLEFLKTSRSPKVLIVLPTTCIIRTIRIPTSLNTSIQIILFFFIFISLKKRKDY